MQVRRGPALRCEAVQDGRETISADAAETVHVLPGVAGPRREPFEAVFIAVGAWGVGDHAVVELLVAGHEGGEHEPVRGRVGGQSGPRAGGPGEARREGAR